MNTIMTFPDTVEEFMEQYKIVDSKHIYTNGAELVPLFRMKQWFDHHPSIDLVRCGECKHYMDNNICPLSWECFDGNDFCSHGERRNDE